MEYYHVIANANIKNVLQFNLIHCIYVSNLKESLFVSIDEGLEQEVGSRAAPLRLHLQQREGSRRTGTHQPRHGAGRVQRGAAGSP